MRTISFIIILIIGYISSAQEVKLGLPVGHVGPVFSALFSPDGETIVTASEDNTARIWEKSTGKILHVLEGHSDALESAQFSSDGKYIVTASWDNTARIWEVSTGKTLQILEGHTSKLLSAQFSPDGETILTASGDDTSRIWEVTTGKTLQVLRGHKKKLTSAHFSPDGNIIVTTSWDNTARIWDASTGKTLQILEGYSASLESAEFSPDGKNIVITSRDITAQIWEVSTGKVHQILEGHTENLTSAQFGPNGTTIVTTSYDKTARIWDVSTGKTLQVMEGNTEYLLSAQFSPDGKSIVTTSSSGDKTARIWDVSTGKVLQVLEGHVFMLESAQFSPEGETIVTTSWDHTARIWEVSSGKTLQILEGHAGNWLSPQFSPDGKTVVIVSLDKIARIWEVLSGKTLQILEGHTGALLSAQFSPDGNTVVTTSWDRTARIWDVSTGKNIQVLEGHTNLIQSAHFSLDGKTIVTTSKDNTARVWDISTGRTIQILKGQNWEVSSAQFSPNGKTIVTTTSWGNDVQIWEVSTGKPIQILKGHTYIVMSAQFSPDGTKIVTSSKDNTSRVWDVSNGRTIQILKGHTGSVMAAQFSPDGNTIITTSWDNTARFWDVLTGKVIHMLDLDTDARTSAQFSPDGKTIATASWHGSSSIQVVDSRTKLMDNFIFDSDPNKWVHLHPSGLFDASSEAMELMYWTKELEAIEFSQLKDRYWLPGLWEKVMRGETLPNVRNMSKLELQPIVELQNVTDDGVTIHLKKREGGYGKVSLSINGKEAFNDVRLSDMDYTLKEQTIYVSIKDHPYLIEGENEITVKASSEDGFVQGRGSKGKALVKKKALTQPQFFGVVIGVGDYANDQLNLKYTVNDAEAISKAMQLGAENLFNEDRTHMYTITSKSDALPNKENIRNVFKEISSKANAEDIITVYLSGHGITWGGNQGDFYFLTSDATATTNEAYNDPAIRQSNTISTSEWVDWLKDISALKQVMIIDACGSGKAVDNLISERDIEPSQIKAIDRMKDRTGMYIISGCTADAVSYEASMYGQGLLTYSILQAMKGAALKEDKFVDIFTIMDYAREAVPKLAEGIGGVQEPQLLVPKGGSFDIGMLETSDKEAIPLASPKTVFVRSILVNADNFEDSLGLTELLNRELTLVASKGKNSPLVYFDSAKFPNSCKISGGYTTGENDISITIKLRCGEDLKSFELNAETKELLIKGIVGLIKN